MDIDAAPRLLHRRRRSGEDEDEERRRRRKKTKKKFTEGVMEEQDDDDEDDDEALPGESESHRDMDKKWKMKKVSKMLKKEKANKRVEEEEEEEEEEDFAGGGFDHREEKNKTTERHKIVSKEEIEQSQKQQKKRGVVYLGSIPPFMKPLKLRQLLEKFGKLERMYLAPEDPEQRALRKKYKGNTGKKFVEGWVEFKNKRKARSAAEMLNGQPVGGKRRSAHYSDLWNIRYLPKFKWDNLMEEIEYQKAAREQRQRLELEMAKKERDFYMARVEQAKMIASMEERRKKRVAENPDSVPESPEEQMKMAKLQEKQEKSRLLRTFKQRKALDDPNIDSKQGMMSLDMIKSLFGNPIKKKSEVGIYH